MHKSVRRMVGQPFEVGFEISSLPGGNYWITIDLGVGMRRRRCRNGQIGFHMSENDPLARRICCENQHQAMSKLV